MCTFANQQIIEKIICEKVDRREMFTALDVTLEAKRRGGSERHRHLKHAVHQFFAGGGLGADYNRTLIAIPGAPCPAWLYYPNGMGPGTFRPLDRSLMNVGHNGTRRAGGGPGDGYWVDKRARICVPVRFLRRVGLQPGDEAVVVADRRKSRLALTKTAPSTKRGKVLARYRVDRHGNVRIAQGILQRAQLGGQSYDLAGDGRKITLWLHGSPV
jgi:bifunctional DNA-binding transcriptional regulator/antitoxin component of YhaV-PrlF toxin-antitoxin module